MSEGFTKLWRFDYGRSGCVSFGIHKDGYLALQFFDFEYDIYSIYTWAMNRSDFEKMKAWANGYDGEEFITDMKGALWSGGLRSKTYIRFYQDRVKRFGRDNYPVHKMAIYLDSTMEPHNIPNDKTIEELNEGDQAIGGIIDYEIPFNGAEETARPGQTLEDLRVAIECIGAFNMDYFNE